MDYWLLYNLSDGMSEFICGFGSFWLISGPIIDKLMAKSGVVERLCTGLQDGAQSKRKN